MARYARQSGDLSQHLCASQADRPVRFIREFDGKIVARYWHFRDADDYYSHAASAQVVDRIAGAHANSVAPRTIPSFALPP